MVVYDSMYGSAHFYSQLTVNGRSYTENGLHRCTPALFRQYGPDSAYELTPPLSLSSGIHPEAGCEFSRIKIPFGSLHDAGPGVGHHLWSDFILELKSATFMVLSVNDAAYNGLGMLCCWIDGVRVVTQKGPQTNVEISFHVDWWLTMSDRVSYGAGRILRGPQSLARPDDTPPRMWVEDTVIDLGNKAHPWIVVLYTKSETISGRALTYYKLAFWKYGEAVNNVASPDRSDMYNGLLEEVLEIDPNAILGVWGCPIQPRPTDTPKVNTQQTRAWYEGNPGDIIPYILWEDQDNTYKTDDDAKWMITDPTGSIMGTLPWGVEFDTVTAILDIGPAGAYLQIGTELLHVTGATEGLGEGRIFSIPLPSIPVTENAMQSYTYTGEREYDKTMREIQKNQAAVNGIAGVGTSAIGGAIAGSAISPGVGTAAGAIGGIISSTLGTAVSYVTAGHFDRKTQEAVDKLKSNQTAGTIVSAGGVPWLTGIGRNGRMWTLLKMVRDPVSAAEISNEHSELGYRTDSYSTDCTTLISDGGGLRIEGLEVFGAGPEATRYIENIFARGVHIDIPSP